MAPKIVGPYLVLGTLGKGGVGTVYRATDRRSGEEVALKLLSTGPALEPTVARRLVREFEALAELSHPNVVRVFDAGVFQGYPYLVMELVEGLDLRSYLSVDLGAPRPGRYHDSPSDSAWVPAFDDAQDEEPGTTADGGDEDDEGDGDDELPLTPPPVPRFGVDELFTEADTDEFLAATAGSHRHGKRALRDYASLAGEPDTDLGPPPDPSSSVDALPPLLPASPPADAPARQGISLEELNRPERIGRLKDTMLQICEALSYIHARGLVHRDLKPGNIMVDEDRRVRLMDFGLAKHLAEETNVTAVGRVVGTYRYMAPEQAMGERVDGRADLYSLGVLLYELLAGRPPYDGQTATDLWQEILEKEPVPISALNPGADEVLVRIAHRLLRKDPYERFQTAEEVFELLIAG